MENRLAIVVPCYNEEAVLAETTKRLSRLLDELIAGQSGGGGGRRWRPTASSSMSTTAAATRHGP